MNDSTATTSKPTRKRKSGIPTGNAGEYLVMGELLRRGFDAQLADRNTKGYDIIVGVEGGDLRRVQVKTVRAAPWYVSRSMFEGAALDQITIYVLLGREDGRKPVRYFITKNRDLAQHAHYPEKWRLNGFMKLAVMEHCEGDWEAIKSYCLARQAE
jgi:hypothetical protein